MVDFVHERAAIVDICHQLSDQGYLAGTGGNVALRLNKDLFAITPSATDYTTLTPADIAVIRLNGLEQIDGNKPASVEKGLHARMLSMFPDRPASIHTHQPVASAVALLHKRLEWPGGSDKVVIGDHIALAKYRPSGTGMLVKALGKALRKDAYCYLLASHGVIASASSLEHGADLVAKIEDAAAQYLSPLIRNNPNLSDVTRQMTLGTLEGILTKGSES